MSTYRYSRQSFLGVESERLIDACLVGIVGLGGGGSHIVQQLAHVGFKKYVLYDSDRAEISNLNRTVGMTIDDVVLKNEKIKIAVRKIKELHPEAKINAIPSRWQENPLPLRSCDIIFGCVDGFSERGQLEASSRRYLIPYIDIGLSVTHVRPESPRMGGQVILSLPGKPCLRCIGFLTEDKLTLEAANYGAAGQWPQVIWANGILASAAVGIAIDLLTGWTNISREVVYLSYDGNSGLVQTHPRLNYISVKPYCPHYPLENTGDPLYKSM